MSANVPPVWRSLMNELNGGRIPDGEPGIRDVDAPCDAFQPAGKPFEPAEGNGDCETDGHYICSECVHISQRAMRLRQDLCEDCGAKMERTKRGESCPNGCDDVTINFPAATVSL